MRRPTAQELLAIRFALHQEEGGTETPAQFLRQEIGLGWEPNPDYITIYDSYMPDGPSWTGKLGVMVGGESCFITTCQFRTNGTVRIASGEILSFETVEAKALYGETQ